jgi:Carboxypeptidase regulatory-like domain
MRLSALWTGTSSTKCVGNRRRRFVPCLLLFLAAVAGVAEAQPTQLTVQVLQPNGSPISLATVCMAAGSSMAGSRLTTQGVAVLTGLPAGSYTLHVIKSNFQTNSQTVNLSGTLELTVTLQPGASTPPAGVNCQVGGAPTTLTPIKITSFEVVDLPADFKVTSPPATQLVLRATFDRKPDFFRIVEGNGYAYTTPLQNLQTVSWRPINLAFNAPFIYFLPLNLGAPYGTRVVYLQVSSGPVASEDAASQIKSVSVIRTPAQLRTSVLTGAALQEFLDRAQLEGYRPLKFKAFSITPNPDDECVGGTHAILENQPTLSAPGTYTQPARPLNVLIEKSVFHAFSPPGDPSGSGLQTLMPFFKITDLGVQPTYFTSLDLSLPRYWIDTTTFSVSGFTMVNNSFQPPLQAPERIITIEKTYRFNSTKFVNCLDGSPTPHIPFLPTFTSVTVVGPDGRHPCEAFVSSVPAPRCGLPPLPPVHGTGTIIP